MAFQKRLPCGCIIEAFVFELDKKNNNMYMLGSHQHVHICNTCKIKKENLSEEENDILYDMWTYHNRTNDFGYGAWIKKNKQK
jgi:hypothetical protein